jgi:hypothetical protein
MFHTEETGEVRKRVVFIFKFKIVYSDNVYTHESPYDFEIKSQVEVCDSGT